MLSHFTRPQIYLIKWPEVYLIKWVAILKGVPNRVATDAYTGLLAKMATGVPDEGVPNKVASHVHFI